jgi:hypothetical protein
MIRSTLLLGVLAALLAAPVSAQDATPTPAPQHKHDAMYHKARPMTFTNPNGKTSTASGASCIGHNANATQTVVNPITNQPQAAPIVEVPVSAGGGSIPAATNHAQQAQTCGTRTR